MWKALENAALPLKKGGLFFIAIYNDQGWKSDAWTAVKKIYNSSFLGYLLVCSVFLPYFIFKACVKCLVKGENVFATYKSVRGMSIYYDWFDWLGGYPFQVAGVEQIKKFYEPKGFVLQKLTTTTSLGTPNLSIIIALKQYPVSAKMICIRATNRAKKAQATIPVNKTSNPDVRVIIPARRYTILPIYQCVVLILNTDIFLLFIFNN
jgi:hypothetical protein